LAGLTQSQYLGMSRGIMQLFAAVAAPSDDLILPDDDGAYRDLPCRQRPVGLNQHLMHPIIMIH
jgi:hypothetical protein